MIKKRLKKAEFQRIANTVNIIDVIGRVATLQRSGGYYRACCPFHNEKTPSFIAYYSWFVS